MGIVQLSMFDGKVCVRCKQQKPRDCFYRSNRFKDGLRQWCKDCEIAYNREYASENRDKINQSQRKYYDKPENRQRRRLLDNNRYHAKHDEIRSRRNASYQKDPDRIKDQVRAYRERNPDKIKETSKKMWQRHGHIYRKRHEEYRMQHRDILLEKNRQRYANNPEKTKEQARQWRKANPDKRRVQHHRRRARELAGGSYTAEQWTALCDWFGNVCLACGSPDLLTVDHVIPLIKNGRNTIDNLQPLCFSCNSSKRTNTVDYRDPDRLAAFLEMIHGQEILPRSTDCSNTIR